MCSNFVFCRVDLVKKRSPILTPHGITQPQTTSGDGGDGGWGDGEGDGGMGGMGGHSGNRVGGGSEEIGNGEMGAHMGPNYLVKWGVPVGPQITGKMGVVQEPTASRA